MKTSTSTMTLPVRLTELATAMLCLVGSLSGCAVGPAKLQNQADEKATAVQALQTQAKQQHVEDPPLLRIRGNFLGSGAEELSSSALPDRFRSFAMNFGEGTGTLNTVAENLRRATGLAVRISPDVYASPLASPSGMLQLSSAAPQSAQPVQLTTAPAAGPNGSRDYIPNPSPNAGSATAMGTTVTAARVALPSPMTTPLPLSFNGDLSVYLDQIAGALGIQADYQHGEIYFHRLSTRIFSLQLPAGTLSYHDDLTGGGAGTINTGASGGQGAAAFGSNSSATVDARLDMWGAVDSALKAFKSSMGQYAINQASGTIVMTDTRDTLDRVAAWVQHENLSMNTQVSIEVRRINVQLNDNSQLGVNLNLVYQKLTGDGKPSWSLGSTSPAALTNSSTTGSVTYNVLRSNSSTNGTTLSAQALNQFGRVVSDLTDTLIATNRRPGRRQRVTDQAYLASTTPGAGSITGTSSGVPGLTPGVVSYGSNLIITPIIGDNRMVTLELSDTQSDLLGIQSTSAGSGVTAQSISTPTLARDKAAGSFVVTAGDSLVIVGTNSDAWSGNSAVGLSGGSHTGTRTRLMQVLIVTPRIIPNNFSS